MDNIDIQMLNLACQNLEASKLLLSRGFYPQAVFFFQQSVEISVKQFGLFIQVIDKDELKKYISHFSAKVFVKIFTAAGEKIQSLENLSSVYPDVKVRNFYKEVNPREKLSQINRQVDFLKNAKELDLETVDDESCKEILSIMDKNFREAEKIVLDREKTREIINEIEWQKIKKEYLDFFSAFGNEQVTYINDQLEKSITEDSFKELMGTFLFYSLSFMRYFNPIYLNLYYFSLITAGLALITRYPDDDFSKFPNDVFTENHPLIYYLAEFQKRLNKVLLMQKELTMMDIEMRESTVGSVQ